jgi:hypothetical protein
VFAVAQEELLAPGKFLASRAAGRNGIYCEAWNFLMRGSNGLVAKFGYLRVILKIRDVSLTDRPVLATTKVFER